MRMCRGMEVCMSDVSTSIVDNLGARRKGWHHEHLRKVSTDEVVVLALLCRELHWVQRHPPVPVKLQHTL